MLSVQFIRENLDRVKRDLLLRGATAPVDRIIALDEERRTILPQVESLRAERNVASKTIGATKDAADRESRIAAMRAVGERLGSLEARLKAVDVELQAKLYEVPNIVDPSVPPGPDDSSNVEIEREESNKRHFDFTPRPHWELGEILGGIDLERGARMSGSRFYVLAGGIGRLYRSLIQWCLNEHVEAGFSERYLPYMVSEASLYASGHLPKFRDNLYFDGEEDYFFIPTAEAPFVNLYRDEILPPGTLPLRLVAHTPCFRREKMSAGRDVRGIKRGHQFEKVEMFVYCEPAESAAELEALVGRAKSLPAKLGIPYRVLRLCSGDIDFKATNGMDVEMWAPGVNEWLEVSSASNCLDFQARRANIRYRPSAEAPTRYPHMLNASGLGMVRTLISVMENYQEADGSIIVPEVIRPYMGTDCIRPPERR